LGFPNWSCETSDTKETIATKVKVQLTTAEWDAIKVVVNNRAAIPIDARREVLLG
jgi:hypothetical protein